VHQDTKQILEETNGARTCHQSQPTSKSTNNNTNLFINGENMSYHVKGVDMEITPTIWTIVTVLKYFGSRIGKRNTISVEEFN